MPPLSDKEREELMAAGKSLAQPPSSLDELLPLLDQIEKLLSKVEQLPATSRQTALSPLMKALVMKELLKHSDVDVRLGVASCISEITRITAPDVPYDDDKMKDVFQLIVSFFENLSDVSSRSYEKRATILETMAKVRSSVIMLDLECNEMIIGMFQHFLKAIRACHAETIFASMETIMTLVLEESEDISPDLLTPILATLKRNNEAVMPIAKKLAERVIQNSADKLRPFLRQAVKYLNTSLDDYSEVVASVFRENSDSVVHCNEGIVDERLAITPQKSPLKSMKDEGIHDGTPTMDHRRKRIPDKERASEIIEYGKNLVGSKVKIWWPEDRIFYEGIVASFDSDQNKHKVLYDDGDEEVLNLRRESWEFVADDFVSDGDQAVKHSSHATSSDVQRTNKRQGTTNSETSSNHQKVEGSPKSKLKYTATKSGGKSKDDGKVVPEPRDNYSKPRKISIDDTIKSKYQSQKLGGKGQADSAKASSISKDGVTKISSHSKQDSQQTSNCKEMSMRDRLRSIRDADGRPQQNHSALHLPDEKEKEAPATGEPKKVEEIFNSHPIFKVSDGDTCAHNIQRLATPADWQALVGKSYAEKIKLFSAYQAKATAVLSDVMVDLRVNPLYTELETLKKEFHAFKIREKILRLSNKKLMKKTQVVMAMHKSLEDKIRELEVQNKKAKEQLMSVATGCSEAGKDGFEEGFKIFPSSRQWQAYLHQFWKEEKAKFLKSGEFLDHVQLGAFQYLTYGFESAVKQAREKGFTEPFDKDAAIDNAPELKGWEASPS